MRRWAGGRPSLDAQITWWTDTPGLLTRLDGRGRTRSAGRLVEPVDLRHEHDPVGAVVPADHLESAPLLVASVVTMLFFLSPVLALDRAGGGGPAGSSRCVLAQSCSGRAGDTRSSRPARWRRSWTRRSGGPVVKGFGQEEQELERMKAPARRCTPRRAPGPGRWPGDPAPDRRAHARAGRDPGWAAGWRSTATSPSAPSCSSPATLADMSGGPDATAWSPSGRSPGPA